MAITFNGTTDEIQFTGAAAWPTWTGITVACLFYKNASSAVQNLYLADATGSPADIRLSFSATDKIRLFLNGTNAAGANTFGTGQHLAGAIKGTGLVAPSFPYITPLGGTWAVDTTATVLNDPTTTAPGVAETLGSQNGSSFFNGDITALGVWSRALGLDEFKSLLDIGYKNWWTVPGCARLFVLDQHSTSTKVIDLAGSGAKESTRTGTSIATRSVPMARMHGRYWQIEQRLAATAVNVAAGSASATGTAYTAALTLSGSAANASGTGSANTPAPSISVNAGAVSGSGTAFNATVSTAASITVNAGSASATGSAYAATLTLSTAGGASSGTATAGGPSSSISVGAGAGSASGAAFNATVSTAAFLSVNAGAASGTGTAYDATVTTLSTTNPAAQRALGAGSAYNATVHIVSGGNLHQAYDVFLGSSADILITLTPSADLLL